MFLNEERTRMGRKEKKEERSPFSACKSEDRDRFLKRGKVLHLKQGELLTQENEPRKGVFSLEEGVLKLGRSILGSKPSPLLYMKEGDLIGLEAMIHDHPHPYSIEAATDAKVIRYPEVDIRGLMEADPEFQLRLIRDLCSRLKLIEERTEDLFMKSTAQRLADHILHLREIASSDRKDAFDFHMEEAADHVGSTPDYLHKVIIDMSKKKALSLRRKRLRVLDPDRLKRIADGE